MSLVNGDPQSGNRPGCWGRSDIYDSEDRECRGCGFQNSCRNQVIKMVSNNQQTVPQVSTTPSYYSPYPQVQPYTMPAPVHTGIVPAPAPVPVARFVPPAPAPVPAPIAAPAYAAPVRVPAQIPTAQPQVPTIQMPVMPQDWYGRIQDPLFFSILSPPPFRPQMMGESFGERFLKNLMLDLGTMACFHAGLALRQMFIPPQPQERIIDGK